MRRGANHCLGVVLDGRGTCGALILGCGMGPGWLRVGRAGAGWVCLEALPHAGICWMCCLPM